MLRLHSLCKPFVRKGRSKLSLDAQAAGEIFCLKIAYTFREVSEITCFRYRAGEKAYVCFEVDLLFLKPVD
jgi:hypothetical protein